MPRENYNLPSQGLQSERPHERLRSEPLYERETQRLNATNFQTERRVYYRGSTIPQTALFCSSQTANHFRNRLYGSMNITITDLLTIISTFLTVYVNTTVVFPLTQIASSYREKSTLFCNRKDLFIKSHMHLVVNRCQNHFPFHFTSKAPQSLIRSI